MDYSDKFTGVLTKYKGQKIQVFFNYEWTHQTKCEGILGEIFFDGFFINSGKKDKPDIRICYLKNIIYIKLSE